MNTKYVLVTAARNEDAFIEKTIKSVIAQTVRPMKWAIVSDGSTDRTEEIVNDYSKYYCFMHLIVTEGEGSRNFSSKVNAIHKGLDSLVHLDYCFIGILDADIVLEKNYFEVMLERFDLNEKLGLAGGWTYDPINGQFQETPGNRKRSVAGGTSIFRRECFEGIGGYLPIATGGEDHLAEIMARMHEWKTETFLDQKVFHLRAHSIEGTNLLGARYRLGLQDYFLGYHPFYEILKSLSRIPLRPYLIGSICSLWGYFHGALSRKPIIVPTDVAEYLRSEQIDRIKKIFKKGPGGSFS